MKRNSKIRKRKSTFEPSTKPNGEEGEGKVKCPLPLSSNEVQNTRPSLFIPDIEAYKVITSIGDGV